MQTEDALSSGAPMPALTGATGTPAIAASNPPMATLALDAPQQVKAIEVSDMTETGATSGTQLQTAELALPQLSRAMTGAAGFAPAAPESTAPELMAAMTGAADNSTQYANQTPDLPPMPTEAPQTVVEVPHAQPISQAPSVPSVYDLDYEIQK